MDDLVSVPGPSTSTEFGESNSVQGNRLPRFDDDIGEFYFESDALPLKTNHDYKAMLKAMAKLESQRIRAIKDLDRLREVRQEALADPIKFVECLQKGENLELPSPQEVIALPYIDWKKYRLNSGASPLLDKRIASRNWTRGFGPHEEDNDSVDSQTENPKNVVRGRVVKKSKSATFNQLWTAEEQKKLEELLIKHPPEEIESRRFAKIANELGNRTPQQVHSRIQKFFIKLGKAGLPIPGRRPALTAIRKGRPGIRRGSNRVGRDIYKYASSSFFKHNLPPVYMDESNLSDDHSSYSPNTLLPNDANDNEENEENEFDEPGDLENDPESEEIRFLQRLKEERLGKQGLAQHIGFKCDRCGCNPIIGTRWHCLDCPTNQSTDFCDDCVDCQHESGSHMADHVVEPKDRSDNPKPFLDRDYLHFMGGDYNYLDPNYMPAT